MSALRAIGPIDGRYAHQTQELSDYFSEYALIRYRVLVEVRYLQALHRLGLPQLSHVTAVQMDDLNRIVAKFSEADAEAIKKTERTTNHDVKAVEYFVKEHVAASGLGEIVEFVHFGLTSQDINNTAIPLTLRDALDEVICPQLESLISLIDRHAMAWADVPMLAKTHGQPASPTLLGKEFSVWTHRLREQLRQLQEIPIPAKFGGATGNLNAHYVTFPDYDWHAFADDFVAKDLGLRRSYPTTQIEHYDNLAAIFHALNRISTILIDLCRDVWQYISMEYFRQQTVAGEIGSSAMPHKVNPIDFENAEGNLGIARALFSHLADKLPISRLQRDLTDSTVLRNLGLPIAHLLLANKAITKGFGKLLINEEKIAADLEANWIVCAEAIQNILRREGYPQPYEALKELTRGRTHFNEASLHDFIDGLNVSDAIKTELKAIRPETYVGRF
ncbi:adenylosuccinate lyase [Neolewinella lacunae]|uniref:Adenylosuccinate lyase n=1 Tax=Neolewinella lacunae TaxID=1517758 RepID=A0A923TCR4_9BACT|nr:adenylosuccinate lyase [Neolewinella lacunae]MBC6994017.1 adenylosuccinate lyase [Neolewinella lacunae]MDN3634687.1 adenylosuccinate lyase [Neolewinella lacunae]